ncbi:MAG TPA: dTDP-Rha--alpha-D-GlcNAc-pyrophosphate polyprenol alpha-3-L-rhamnosyltransferase [Cryomorphaceae bacterium]|nr:dTDP-Rha--alpha-D-GlcNAc-pyrophosphate polyprenol alpha-3-L-rhamnosyltransferase [Owenweeksia sp.]HAD97109.1 dTDP-Rha--alpha-D-GlcNAc-pyrophosphate polyprenol alpha-3-L-rhamnosyltransferase [Cryomorphaceae bacterium]HBF21900.1 dTDP-Rha--alpha-D-GlcNAc-pyrophosphate polyprenol alpha-3-L-rhamnosyltransferase [Cryomorphaceae bacterium]|tara:strand:+ start:2877 stop:3893 length:1017 start_codon:yes stop_codon:yes gene_type:complete
MPKTTAVAILNWNGAHLLQRFLPSVIKYSPDTAEIYVIDNASSDASLEILAKEFPSVKLIRNAGNYGYAQGYNEGLNSIPEEFVVLLNSDVEVTENWLTPLINHLEKQPNLGAIQPKIRDLKQPDHFEYAGASGGWVDTLGYPFCRGRIFDSLEKDQGQYDTYQEVFWASGACLAVRKEAFRKAGKLDESFFAHMEEIDLCWRMHLNGYKVACEPTSVVYHLGGATLNKLSPQKTYLNFRNSLIMLYLNLPGFEGFSKILQRLVLDGVAGIKFMLEGKFPHVWSILRAHFSFYSRFNALSRKRINRPARPLKDLPGVYKHSVVKAFYLGGKKRFGDLF